VAQEDDPRETNPQDVQMRPPQFLDHPGFCLAKNLLQRCEKTGFDEDYQQQYRLDTRLSKKTRNSEKLLRNLLKRRIDLAIL
jgi:hypothetical protein